MQAVYNENSKYGTWTSGWLNTIKKITGTEFKTSDSSSVIDPEDTNLFFQRSNHDTLLSPGNYLFRKEFASPLSMCLRWEGLWLVWSVHLPAGPVGFPYWPFNSSLRQQSVILPWKLSNLSPIPKEFPLSSCAQLRPISLTNIIMRLLGRLVCKLETFMELKSLIVMD